MSVNASALSQEFPLEAQLLALDEEQIPRWLVQHQDLLDLDLVARLKQSADSESALANLPRAEKASRCALLIASHLTEEPLALALAHWARGNYAMHAKPHEAIWHYHQAIAGYDAISDTTSVGRLWANLVGVYAECGQFAQATNAYHHAHPHLAACVEQYPRYLLRLEQNYGWNLHCQGRYIEAIALYDRALALASRQDELAGIAVEVRVNRNLSLGFLGRVAEIEASYKQERAKAATLHQDLTVARIDMNLGELFTFLGQPTLALRRFRQAQEIFARHGNEMEVGWVMQRQAALLEQIGDRRAAIRYYGQALEIAQRNALEPQMGEIWLQLAEAWRQEHEFGRAIYALTQADEIWQRLKHGFWLTKVLIAKVALALAQENLSVAGSVMQQAPPTLDNPRLRAEYTYYIAETGTLRHQLHTDQADYSQTLQAYQDARQQAKLVGNRWLERQALVGQARLLIRRDPPQARLLFEAALLLDDQIRQVLSVEELKASFHQQSHELFAELIQLDMAADEPINALMHIWRTKASAFLELRQSTAPKTKSDASFQAIESTRQQLAALRWTLAQHPDNRLPDQQRERSNQQIAALEQHLLALRRSAMAEGGQEQGALLTDPRRILADMEADLLLEYTCCGNEIVGVCANRQGDCRVLTLVAVDAIADLRDELQMIFENVARRPTDQRLRLQQSWLAECRPLLQEAYEKLVLPLLEIAWQWQGVINHILLAPCEPLFLLPFAAFWDGHHFLIEHYQIEQIASGGQLVQPLATANHLAAPIIIAATTGAMLAVRHEAQRIVATLPQSRCYIDTPVLAALRSLPIPPRYLHIAAHTLQRHDAPLFSALHLTGEVLSVEQSFELPLQGTELVVLSGCSTGGGMESSSALLAFQPAFLIAGAQRVLTTLWPIADDATPFWMETFYRHLAAGCSVLLAMQRTQQTLLAMPAYAHPALWAAFTCTRQ